MNKPISIIVVEDDPVVLNRFMTMFTTNPAFRLIAACSNATSARSVINSDTADVLLTDLGLPDGNGLDLIRQCSDLHPDTQIMVISVFGDEKHVITAIEAGATGYILKDDDSMEVEQSIQQMCAGGSPISPAVASHLLKRLRPEADEVKLTKAEMEILRCIAKGYTAQEAADMKHISYHTVTSHIKSIYRKLHISTRAEAVYEAVKRHLL
ncbi:response regulator [Thiothrix winogradskyi]|uniref:Response regulator transcription factor n=1 Tax=Thiothrix winogradskyi TaxID=96472 RepID=A0ABY3SVN7_9GAMM|nr:response regulator transcription factor [Thiothrix winogradskyi]UJS23470.1 response regulator transcription factor [Thiothrix winogradskyi]